MTIDDRQITVGKLEAAERQLDCAITLWFNNGDDVSIHSLAASAHQVLHNIYERQSGIGSFLFNSGIFRDEDSFKRWMKLIRRPANFFKHADNDPDPNGTLEFPAYAAIAYFVFSTQTLQLLRRPISRTGFAFLTWMAIRETSEVSDEFIKFVQDKIPVNSRDFLRSLSKPEFLKLYLENR